MSEISLIIVSWNARDYLERCLASAHETRGTVVREVIVVDNASSDGSPEMVAKAFPEVTLMHRFENLGFARGNNLGIRHASGSLLAMVNSDVVIHQECLQKLAAFLKSHPEVGLVGPKVFGRDGKVQPTCGRLPTVWNTICEYWLLHKIFPGWPLFSGFQIRQVETKGPTTVQVMSGCFWLARKAAVDQVGLLDEQFFFYAEDVDWCKRLMDAGWRIAIVPEATATHFGGGSSQNASLRYSIEMLRANLFYWKKHHGNLGRSAFYLVAIVQHCLRLAVRGILGIAGTSGREQNRHKFREHLICLYWLVSGKGL